MIRSELIERIDRAVPTEGSLEVLTGVRLRRVNEPTELGHGSSFPSFCVIAQGSKELRLGDRRYQYDEGHFLVSTATLPISSRVLEASPERPYLGVVVGLDPRVVGSVMVEIGRPALHGSLEVSAIEVDRLDHALLDATLRLVRLL